MTVASRFPGHDKDKKTIKKTSPTGTATAPTKQQVLFKAITEVFGWEPITDRDKKRVGALARDFALKGADPTELGIRAGRYRKAWPNCTCTPEALLKHWHEFEKDKPHGNRSGRTNGSPARVTASADKRSRYAALTG